MELTHNRMAKTAASVLRHSFEQHMIAFINRNADVFSALTRPGTPFGGNWLTND